MKYIGLLLIFTAAFALFLSYIRGIEKRKKETAAVLSLVSHIRSEITAFQKPIPEIIALYDNHDLQKSGFLDYAREEGLSAAARHAPPFLSLSREGARILSSYAAEAGRGYTAEEVRKLEHCENALREENERLSRELPKEKKLSRALFLSGGLLLFILFW